MRTAPPLWFDGRNHGRSALLVACANAGMTAEQALNELLKQSDAYQAHCAKLLETWPPPIILEAGTEVEALKGENERLRAELAQLKAELSALRPLSEAGTQGEWELGYDNDVGPNDEGYWEWQTAGPAQLHGRGEQPRRDARLIAAAVNAVRRMLAREGGGGGEDDHGQEVHRPA